MTKELLDLHCAHGKPVTSRCRQCEHDIHMGRGKGFTPSTSDESVSDDANREMFGDDAAFGIEWGNK